MRANLQTIKSIVNATEFEKNCAAVLMNGIDRDSDCILVVSASPHERKKVFERFKNTYERCGAIKFIKQYERLETIFGDYIFVDLEDRKALVGRRYFEIMFEEAELS